MTSDLQDNYIFAERQVFVLDQIKNINFADKNSSVAKMWIW